MKKFIFMAIFILPVLFVAKSSGQVTNVGTVVQKDATTHANNDINSTINNNMDKAENKLKGIFKKKKKLSAADSAKNATSAATTTNTTPTTAGAGPNQASAPATASFTSYQNYDFVPGEQIIFSDDFSSDQDGEFPAHWRLLKGQGVVNKVDGKPSLLLTEDGVEIKPRMKADHYLTDAFTLEFDFIFKNYNKQPGTGMFANRANFSPDMGIYFYFKDNGDVNSPPRFHSDFSFFADFGRDEVKIGTFEKNYPDALLNNFAQNWHHAAIIYKSGVMKAYIDQYRVCVDPNIDTPPLRFAFCQGDGYNDKSNAVIITNVKLANGGGMNMIGKKFTDAKIVTHGINFDVNKAIITPGSMGTLNGIVKIMQDNPDLKFEIGGHTDSDGGNDVNMKLSQARADAVRTQLIAMGIDGGRLTTKGYGSTKPIGDNGTLEGKANNRRVEFVRL
jgi:OmpA-OmpF porin, OOP family